MCSFLAFLVPKSTMVEGKTVKQVDGVRNSSKPQQACLQEERRRTASAPLAWLRPWTYPLVLARPMGLSIVRSSANSVVQLLIGSMVTNSHALSYFAQAHLIIAKSAIKNPPLLQILQFPKTVLARYLTNQMAKMAFF